MDAFSYVTVVISVIIGLGLSHLLAGVADLLKARDRVRFHWLTILWIALTFVGHVFLWWTMWNLRLLGTWSFFAFLLILLPPVLLYVAASLLVPKVDGASSLDLRDAFEANRVPFFVVTAAFTAVMTATNWLLTGRMSPGPVTAILLSWVVLLSLGALVKDARYHAALGILMAILFVAFVLQYGLRLGAG